MLANFFQEIHKFYTYGFLFVSILLTTLAHHSLKGISRTSTTVEFSFLEFFDIVITLGSTEVCFYFSWRERRSREVRRMFVLSSIRRLIIFNNTKSSLYRIWFRFLFFCILLILFSVNLLKSSSSIFWHLLSKPCSLTSFIDRLGIFFSLDGFFDEAIIGTFESCFPCV